MRVFRRRLLGAALIAILAWASSCSSDSSGGSNGGTPGDDAGSNDAGPSFGTSACATCVATACATEQDACAGDPECAAYLDCVRACPIGALGNADAACEAACPLPSSANGQKAQGDWTACRATGAGAGCAPCGASVPDSGDASDGSIMNQSCPPSTVSGACGKCNQEKCCETEAACAANPDCDAFFTCFDACQTKGEYESCYQNCVATHASGVEPAIRFQACLTAQCATTCQTSIGPCLTCWLDKCGAVLVNCWAHVECFAIEQCVADCPDNFCSPTCLNGRSDEALQLWNANGACINANCLAACPS